MSNEPDWGLLSDPTVVKVIDSATRSAYRKSSQHLWDEEDLQQEAYMIVATNPMYGRLLDEGKLNHFARELWCDLMDKLGTEVDRNAKMEDLGSVPLLFQRPEDDIKD